VNRFRSKLRTIAFWAIYDPANKQLITSRPTKRELVKRCYIPYGCVVVQMKGHYFPVRRNP